MDYVALQKEKERHGYSVCVGGGSKIEREGATKGRETEGRIRRGGERESVCGGGGVFMDVVAENVEMLRLL